MHTVKNPGEGVAHSFAKIPGGWVNSFWTKLPGGSPYFGYICINKVFLISLGGSYVIPPSPLNPCVHLYFYERRLILFSERALKARTLSFLRTPWSSSWTRSSATPAWTRSCTLTTTRSGWWRSSTTTKRIRTTSQRPLSPSTASQTTWCPTKILQSFSIVSTFTK